jgi:hypothetical protein
MKNLELNIGKLTIVIGVILDLLVYGIVYYFGYKHGKHDFETIQTNMKIEIEKIAQN